MSLEDEALHYMKNRSDGSAVFKETLASTLDNVRLYVVDNMYSSSEREQALIRLEEFMLWVNAATDKYGVKPYQQGEY